jgi:ribosomal protein L29
MTRDEDKSKEELLQELAALRAELAVLRATNNGSLERGKPLFPEPAGDQT